MPAVKIGQLLKGPTSLGMRGIIHNDHVLFDVHGVIRIERYLDTQPIAQMQVYIA